MNVSQSADTAFMESLKVQDPERYSNLLKNLRRDSPEAEMDESQALSNYILGLPTGGFTFAVYKRPSILDETLQNGSTEDYVAAILSVATSDDDNFVVRESAHESAKEAVSVSPSKGGRPRKRRMCLNVSDGSHALPIDTRASARYCNDACQQAAYRLRKSLRDAVAA